MLMLFVRLLVLTSLSIVLRSQPQALLQSGTVDVQLINWHGRRLPNYSLTITVNKGDGSDRREVTGPGPNTILLRYGSCRVRAFASLHDSTETEFTVDSARSLLVVSLPPTKWAESSDRYSELAGRISGKLPEPMKLTVRILSLFGTYTRYESVKSDGTFEISAVPDGEYLLLILDEFKIRREVRVSKTPQLSEVTIDLGL